MLSSRKWFWLSVLLLMVPFAAFFLFTSQPVQKRWAVWSLTRVVDRGYDMYEMEASGKGAFWPLEHAIHFVSAQHAEAEACDALVARLRGTTDAVQYRAMLGLQVMGRDARSALPELLRLYDEAASNSSAEEFVCSTIFGIDRQFAEECGAANTIREFNRSRGLIPFIPDPPPKDSMRPSDTP